jgi:hypothetical protein
MRDARQSETQGPSSPHGEYFPPEAVLEARLSSFSTAMFL